MRKIVANIAAVASLSLALVPVLGLTQAANAAEPSVRVSYGDLDLSNAKHAAIFKARVEAAGDDLCRNKQRAVDLKMPVAACIASVRRDIQRQLPDVQRQALASPSEFKAVEFAAK